RGKANLRRHAHRVRRHDGPDARLRVAPDGIRVERTMPRPDRRAPALRRRQRELQASDRAAVHACLTKTTGKDCNSCNFYQCNYSALMGACPDPTADASCDTIARSCSGFDKTHCRSYLAGMNAKGRESMVKCLTQSCSKGFLMCLQSLPEK